jgi:hypothetical protein
MDIERAVAFIRENPKLYQVVYKDLRRALLRDFPYGLFYREWLELARNATFQILHCLCCPAHA